MPMMLLPGEAGACESYGAERLRGLYVRCLSVWSRALMVHSSPWNGRMRYGPSSAWERPHDGGSASRDPASSREPEGVGPAPRDQPEDGRQVEEAPLGPGRTHRP